MPFEPNNAYAKFYKPDQPRPPHARLSLTFCKRGGYRGYLVALTAGAIGLAARAVSAVWMRHGMRWFDIGRGDAGVPHVGGPGAHL